MKKYSLLATIALIVLGLGLSSYQVESIDSTDDIMSNFFKDYDQFVLQVGDMKKNLSSLSQDQAQEEFLDMRKRFKSLEILLTYMAEPDYNLYLNGAPLPKLEPNVPEVHVLEPEGMQVLDEEIFGEYNKENIADLLTKFHDALIKVKQVLQMNRSGIDNRTLLEAIRSEIVRVVALSLSGFDTPGSGSFPQDGISVFSTIDYYLQHYKPDMTKDELIVFDHIAATKKKLADVDESVNLDFADIIRNHIDPMYKLILEFHLRSGIEHIREVSDYPSQINYYSESIFAKDFLDVTNFINIAKVDQREDRVALGKLLFYDPIMSETGVQSCATCHDPKKGFTDGRKVSIIAMDDREIARNSPTLLNSMYSRRFFHDMRAKKPDLQVDHVIYNKHEFNTDYIKVTKRLLEKKPYRDAFRKSYGQINRYAITDAITQFVSTLSSFDSPFDMYMRRESDTLSQDVIAGFNLFMGKGTCASCHFVPVFNGTIPPAFNDTESEILGVLANNDFDHPVLDEDQGRMANGDVRQESEIYQRSFKTPTVRNAELTAPYMHNGVHNTLEEVIKFYNFGGGQGMGLDVPYQTLPPDSLHLTDKEIGQLVTFMEALTDTVGLTSIPVLPQ